ncbi:hypothetical protein [Bradyrhizobium sp.]
MGKTTNRPNRRRKAGQRSGGWHCGRGAGHGARRGDTEVTQRSSRLFAARRHRCEQGRLGVATGCRAFGRRVAIVFQVEQGKL